MAYRNLITDSVTKHPLQQFPAPSRGISAFLHASSLVCFLMNFQYLRVTPNPVNDSFGWHFQYLTILGLAISTACFTVGLLADITLSRRLFLVKNALSVCCVPLEVVITILYWGLRAIDPKLVLPEWSPKLWLPIDLGFHLVPAISLIIDLLLFSPPWTIAITPSLGLAIGLAFGYWFWIELCYSYNAFYPYPIFTMLDTTSRAMLFATSALIFFVALWSLKFLYKVVNGVEMLKAQPKDGNIKKAQ